MEADWNKYGPSSKWTVCYELSNGRKKTVVERADQVDTRLKYLEWANLRVVSVTKNKET